MDFLRPYDHEWTIIGVWAGGAAKPGAAMGLSADCFSDPEAAEAFGACQALHAQRRPVSLANLDEHLTRSVGAERAQALMQRIMDATSKCRLNGWQLPDAVRIVREAANRRRLIGIGEAIARGAADEQRDLTELTDSAREHLRRVNPARGGWIQATDACLDAYEAAEHCEKPIRTGIHELDTILCGGLRRGELTILGARPAVGKSAALLYMALTAVGEGAKVCFVSLEMSAAQIGARILSAHSRLNPSILQSGRKLSEANWTELASGLDKVSVSGAERLSLLVHGGMTIEELRAEIQNRVDGGGCDLLAVDYLQLLRTKQKTSGDFERLGVVSRGLKALTLDLGIPVIAAAQVRRQGNGGTLRAPGLDELRGSGDLEQDADNVILLHRPEACDDPTLNSPGYRSRHDGLFERAQANDLTLLTFDVAKQRQGRTARAWTLFQPAQMRFIDPGVVNSCT